MTGLTPGAYYTFSVTAENAVSSQDKNTYIRTTNITATMEEGGTLYMMYNVHVATRNLLNDAELPLQCLQITLVC